MVISKGGTSCRDSHEGEERQKGRKTETVTVKARKGIGQGLDVALPRGNGSPYTGP